MRAHITHIVSNVVYVVMINNREYNLIVKLAGRLPGDEDDDLSSPSSNSTGLHTPRQTSSRAKPPCLVTPMSLIQPRSNDDYDDEEVGWAVARRAISCKPNRLLLQPVTTSAASANVTCVAQGLPNLVELGQVDALTSVASLSTRTLAIASRSAVMQEAIALSKAWQQLHQTQPQHTLQQQLVQRPPLPLQRMAPAPLLAQPNAGALLAAAASSKVWQKAMLGHAALLDAVERSKQWMLMLQQAQHLQLLLQQNQQQQPKQEVPRIHLSFSALCLEPNMEPPNTLRLGSLLDESQAVAPLQHQLSHPKEASVDAAGSGSCKLAAITQAQQPLSHQNVVQLDAVAIDSCQVGSYIVPPQQLRHQNTVPVDAHASDRGHKVANDVPPPQLSHLNASPVDAATRASCQVATCTAPQQQHLHLKAVPVDAAPSDGFWAVASSIPQQQIPHLEAAPVDAAPSASGQLVASYTQQQQRPQIIVAPDAACHQGSSLSEPLLSAVADEAGACLEEAARKSKEREVADWDLLSHQFGLPSHNQQPALRTWATPCPKPLKTKPAAGFELPDFACNSAASSPAVCSYSDVCIFVYMCVSLQVTVRVRVDVRVHAFSLIRH